MTTYRKKPVEVEAMQIPYDPHRDSTMEEVGSVARWMVDMGYRSPEESSSEFDLDFFYEEYIHDGHLTPEYGTNYLYIETLEGTMTARPGDFVIRGVAGEFYSCQPEIFHETYEKVYSKGETHGA